MTLRRVRGDAGFTLIELLITIVILGVITIPLANLVITYFRDSTQTTVRLGESHDAQIVNAYWQQDVSSIGVRSSTYDTTNNTFPLGQSVNTSFPCTLPAGVASPLVVLAWSQFDSTGNATLISVAYATQSSGSQLVRLHCTTATLDSSATLTHNLAATPVVSCAGPGGSSCTGSGANVPTTVTLGLSIKDPADSNPAAFPVTLTAQRRQTT